MSGQHPVAVVNAVLLYWYNTGPREQIDAMLGPDPERHPDYIEEWIERLKGGFHETWGYMSVTTKLRYTEAALKTYGGEASLELVYHYSAHREDSDAEKESV